MRGSPVFVLLGDMGAAQCADQRSAVQQLMEAVGKNAQGGGKETPLGRVKEA